jgi:uncharacterized membrane protein (UPF0127 family)
MARRRTQLLLPLLLAAALPARAGGEDAPRLRERTTVTIRGQRIVAEVARTPEEQARGLGGRDGLTPGTGMLFPYTEARRWSFWMKDMRFDIDIVWIRDGKIIDVSRFVPAPRPGAPTLLDALPTFSPKEPADSVLEVAGGTAKARGWEIGDVVRFDPPLP